jgi:hypothetical protein
MFVILLDSLDIKNYIILINKVITGKILILGGLLDVSVICRIAAGRPLPCDPAFFYDRDP